MHHDPRVKIVDPKIVGIVVSQGLDHLLSPGLGFLSVEVARLRLGVQVRDDTIGGLHQCLSLSLFLLDQIPMIFRQGEERGGDQSCSGE